GDQIEKGNAVLELETDKVNVEVNADSSGVITELLAQEGDDVNVGDSIAKIDENAEAGSSADSEESKAAPETKEESKPEPEQKETQKKKPHNQKQKKLLTLMAKRLLLHRQLEN